jgi:hypothetical protein
VVSVARETKSRHAVKRPRLIVEMLLLFLLGRARL